MGRRDRERYSEVRPAGAEAKGAHTLSPGHIPALAALAVNSLVDGVLHEGVSARVIAQP